MRSFGAFPAASTALTVMETAPPTAFSSAYPVDVAILIALKEEWDVFWSIAGQPRAIKDGVSGRYLFDFEVPSLIGRPYRCVAACMGDMGPGQATDATHLLLRTKPRTLVNLGIAAAIHDDLKLCDVVVAEQVDDYLATVKAVPKGNDGWVFEPRGSVYKPTYSLVQDVNNLKYAHPEAFAGWHTVCLSAMTERADKLARAHKTQQIHEAPALERVRLASGPVLAAAESFSRWIRARDGLLKALEMEAAGMMLAAHQRSETTATLVLRGISDFGDRRKSKTDRSSGGAFRYLAMFNATQLLWTMMRHGLPPRHEPSGESQLSVSHGSQTRADYLRAVVASADERRTLAGLRGLSVPLASVYIDAVLQSPDEPAFCGKPLSAWLKAAYAGQAILVLGDPGAGKTELLVHAAGELARTALDDLTAPVPLLLTATDLEVAGALAAALSKRWRIPRENFASLLHAPTARFVLFIDSLDEAPVRRLLEVFEGERRSLESQLDAVVLTSRPAFAPQLRACTRVHITAWDRTRFEQFLARWAEQEAASVTALRAHLDEPHVCELLTNPLTATLCIVAARRHPRSLQRRSLLFAAVFDDVLQWWPKNRSAAPNRPEPHWPKVLPILRDLATTALRERRADLDRDNLVARLRSLARDDWESILDWIECGLGILTPVGDDSVYRFTDRRLMEYLAAQNLVAAPEQLLSAASQPWAHEPVRIAFGLLNGEDPARTSQAFQDLLRRESQDIPGFRDDSLRPVLLAIDVAADNPDLVAPFVNSLAEAIIRRVTEEYSNWVGDIVAQRARRIARAGGPLWACLQPRLVKLLTNEELRLPFDAQTVLPLLRDRESAMQALIHRNVEVRAAACMRLRDFVGDLDVQQSLLFALRDAGDLACPAGWALRHAPRTPAFGSTLAELQALLVAREPCPRYGAAIALHPAEGPADALVNALIVGVAERGTILLPVFEDIAATPDGQKALARITFEKSSQEQLCPPLSARPLLQLPLSDCCRSRMFEVLAASAIPPEVLDDLLKVASNLHSYTESLDALSPAAVYMLLDRVRETDYALCAVAQEQLGKLALADYALANYVLEWWDTIDHTKPELLKNFPGRAVEPLVLAGDARAIEVYAAWLPNSDCLHGQSRAHHGSRIPRDVLVVPAIRDAARLAVLRRSGQHLVLEPMAVKRLSGAWQDDPALLEPFEGALAKEHENWLAATDHSAPQELWMIRHSFIHSQDVVPPPSFRKLLKTIFHDVVHHSSHGEHAISDEGWHFFVRHAIRLAAVSEFGLDVVDDLRFLAGDGKSAPCLKVGLHAACAAWEHIKDADHGLLSSFWASRFHRAESVELISSHALESVIDAAADVWAEKLCSLVGSDRSRVAFPTQALFVFECMPVRAQRQVAKELLDFAGHTPLPWILRRIENRRPMRLADEIRRVAFETQAI